MEYKSNGYHLDIRNLITPLISSNSSHINNPITEFWLKKSRSFNLFGFPIFWRWVYLMKIILETPYLMKMMSLPDEDEPTWWRWWAYLMKMMSLPDEVKMMSLPDEDDEPTWWRLF